MEELENIVQVMIDRKEKTEKIREVVRIWKERNPDKVKALEAAVSASPIVAGSIIYSFLKVPPVYLYDKY